MSKRDIEIRTICPRCAALYRDSVYEVEMVAPEQNRERCMICNSINGRDYKISHKETQK